MTKQYAHQMILLGSEIHDCYSVKEVEYMSL